MQSVRFLILALSIFLSTNSFAETLDISKFKAKAKTNLERIFGAENISRSGQVVFRDGAASTDHEPLSDHAAFMYVVTPKAGVLPLKKEVKLAYRLSLTGKEDVVLFDQLEDGQLIVTLPGEGVASLKPESSSDQIQSLVEQLSKVAPKGQFQALKAVGMLTFKAPILETAALLVTLTQSPLIKSARFGYEYYRVPFIFDPLIVISETGKIDADKYRKLTKELREQGLRFVAATAIPADLQ